MKKMNNISSVVLLAIIGVMSVTLTAQSVSGSVTGAAVGSFSPGAMIAGIRLDSLQLGTGVLIESDGTAEGTFHGVLLGTVLGQPRTLALEGTITQGARAGDGSVTLSGRATLDLGDGTPPMPVSWLSVSVRGNDLVLGVDSTSLPAALNSGSLVIE